MRNHNTGYRSSVAELSGRTVNYGYDNIYRVTSEAIANDAAGNNGTVNYTYDPVGNRTQMTSTLAAVPAGGFGYDADDRLTTDIYDANGNTISSGGITNTYDFENHLIQQGGATFVYDGDGNRVQKTVAGVTTKYLVSEVNPTGYPQVLSETFSGNRTPPYDLSRVYVYGLDRISERRSYFTGTQSLTQTSYYVYDGHGSVRALTDTNGTITDTYDYDAFGNLIHSTGSTPNEFLFAGEQLDSNLNLYYNRARYLNVTTGRFWTMDPAEIAPADPKTLHRYLYVQADPANGLDPTGLYTQAYGYEVEDIVEDEYVAEFGDDPELLSLGEWARVGEPSRSAPYSLKPDILDRRPTRRIWMEIKPLSLSGIARAGASWATYNGVFDPLGIFPDVKWLADGRDFPSSQGQVLVFNMGGILFYTTNQQDYYRFLDTIRVFAVGLASVSLYQLVKALPTTAPSPAAGSEISEISWLARTAIAGTEAETAEVGLDVGVAVY